MTPKGWVGVAMGVTMVLAGWLGVLLLVPHGGSYAQRVNAVCQAHQGVQQIGTVSDRLVVCKDGSAQEAP